MENKQARPLWLHRLLTGLRILSRFLLLLPIPVFSYNVDRSGLFQGDLAPREAANLLLEGKDVTNFEQMDERQVVRLYIQNLTEETTPEVIGLGSSRVLQFTQNIIGSGRCRYTGRDDHVLPDGQGGPAAQNRCVERGPLGAVRR